MATARVPLDEAIFKTASCIKRYPDPVLSRHDCPYPAALTFNAGVLKRENGKYIMIFRNDYGDYDEKRLDGTNIGLAYSDDGIHFNVDPEFCLAKRDEEVRRIYDPRITEIDGDYCICCAVDTMHGVRGAIFTTKDFKKFEIKSISTPDNRNMVLFPEKINGNYVRLERPMPMYSRPTSTGKYTETFDIWLSESPDLVYWGKSRLVLDTEDVPFCNDKIGPGAPPIKTEKGWLCCFHAVDFNEDRGQCGWENAWQKRYTIGIMLLDLNDPSKIIGIHKEPLMVPESYWEMEEGFRTNALFPCGMILEDHDVVRIYYGAGDAVVCMAEAKLDELLALCTPYVPKENKFQ